MVNITIAYPFSVESGSNKHIKNFVRQLCLIFLAIVKRRLIIYNNS
jgi:hypothetical protein